MARHVQDTRFRQLVADITFMLTHWTFTLAFLLNQSGSLFYYYLLGSEPVTVAVPICNSLAFVFTAITSIALGESVESLPYVVAGTTLVVLGAAICMSA